MDEKQTRRGFLKIAGGLGTLIAGVEFARGAEPDPAPEENAGDRQPSENLAKPGEVPRRRFGKSEDIVSAMGLGGHAIGLAQSDEEAIRIVQEAVDNGITFMDNAWEYHGGRSEELMGKALEGRRKDVFLMTKVCSHGRDKTVAMQQLEQSLKRLKTDYLDLWQIHEVVYENDPELHFAKEGAVEALTEAKKQGKVRYVGFTGHKLPSIHKEMLSKDYPFDAVQMPLSGFDSSFRSFEREILPLCIAQGIAPIGMKSLNGNAAAIKKGIVSPEEAIRYAMSLPVATTMSGIDSLEILHKNLEIARKFTPMSLEEKEAFRRKCAPFAADGRFELYKVSIEYEGPPGREQHGLPPKEEVAG